MKTLKELTFYDYIILLILGLFITTGISVYGWYNEYSNNNKKSESIEKRYEEYRNKELLFNDSLKLKQNEIIELNKLNDLLSLKLVEVGKQKKRNYNKYENEIKKDKNITTINSANNIVDSILRTNKIRQ